MSYNESDKYERMTQKPLASLIISLGIPTTITMLVTNLYNLVDTYFVSQLGKSASGATGIVFALMAVLQAVGFLLGQGAGSNISRKLGEKKTDEATEFASTSFFLAIFLSCTVTVIGLIFLEPFMKLLGSTDTILSYSKVYGAYILIAAPAMVTSFVMNNVLRFEGRASLAMIGLTAGGVLNMIGDPILMFGFKMGIAGAGLSTAVSQYISAGILLSMFLRGKTQTRLSFHCFTRQASVLWNIFFTGLPSLVRQGLGSISTMILNHAAKPYGDGAIAAMSIVSRCCMFLFCVGLGIGQGFQPVAGFNYGAKKYSRVKKGFLFTLAFGTGILGIFALSGLLASGHIVEMFCPDADVVHIGTYALRVQCAALFFVPLSVCGNMLFQSIGKSGTATFLSMLRNGVCFIPLILILPNLFRIRGIQIAQPVADVLTSAITVPFFIHFLRNMPSDKESVEKIRQNGK